MEELQNQLLKAMSRFRKLNVYEMFPEVTKSDGMTLMAIGHYNRRNEEKLTVSGLAELINARTSAVSRTLKGLEDMGYIERTVNKADRRNTYVVLTPVGEAECDRIDETMQDFFQAVFNKMEADDLRKLAAYLDELYTVAKTEIMRRSPEKQSR